MRNGPPRGEGDPTAQYVPSTFPGATKTEKKREGPGYDKYLLYININYIININIYINKLYIILYININKYQSINIKIFINIIASTPSLLNPGPLTFGF